MPVSFQVVHLVDIKHSGLGNQCYFINIIIGRSSGGPYTGKVALIIECEL